ncbi:MAG: hypothetical protein ACSHW0_06245 [Thalassotalea sp.]
MSLSDLKKSNKDNGKKKKFTVDEFIADADNYAKGKPEIVSSITNNTQAVKDAIALVKAPKSKAKAKRFRHATFTFNDKTFEQLNQLAKTSKLAKSHILRILISHLAEQDQEAQLQALLGSQVD